MNTSDEIPSQLLKDGDNQISFRMIGSGPRKILFLHGFPASSAHIAAFHPYIESFGLQVLSFDRPGYGDTKTKTECQLQATSEIANVFLQKLGWTNYEIFSVSGGTPFLFPLVQNAKIKPIKITAVSGLGPLSSHKYLNLLSLRARAALKILPLVSRRHRAYIVDRAGKSDLKKSSKVIELILPRSKPDRLILSDPKVAISVASGLHGAFCQDGEGIVRDVKAFKAKIHLDFFDFNGPVHFWHGESDLVLNCKMSERMAASIHGAKYTLMKNEGHFSLIIGKMSEILST